MSIDISGLEEFSDNLEKMVENSNNLDGEHPIQEILNTEFMSAETSFNNFDDFMDASPFKEMEFEDIPDDGLDNFISQNTRFATWKDMLDEAASIFLEKRLFDI